MGNAGAPWRLSGLRIPCCHCHHTDSIPGPLNFCMLRAQTKKNCNAYFGEIRVLNSEGKMTKVGQQPAERDKEVISELWSEGWVYVNPWNQGVWVSWFLGGFFVFWGFFCFFFRATPMAYGSSQARGWTRATAASLHHSSQQRQSPTQWARLRTEPTSS